jgi:hypothetical protein
MSERISGRLRGGVAVLVLAASFVAGEAWAEPLPEGPAMSVLNPKWHAPDGFLSPTLDGSWSFRMVANAWAPNVIKLDAASDSGG